MSHPAPHLPKGLQDREMIEPKDPYGPEYVKALNYFNVVCELGYKDIALLMIKWECRYQWQGSSGSDSYHLGIYAWYGRGSTSTSGGRY